MIRSLAFSFLILVFSGTASAQIEARGDDPARPWAAQADGLLAEGRFVEAEAAYVALAHAQQRKVLTLAVDIHQSVRHLAQERQCDGPPIDAGDTAPVSPHLAPQEQQVGFVPLQPLPLQHRIDFGAKLPGQTKDALDAGAEIGWGDGDRLCRQLSIGFQSRSA